MAEQLNESFRIPVGQLEDFVSAELNGVSDGYSCVVPLKSIKKVQDIRFFKKEVLERILRKIPLRSSSEERVYPYQNSEIRVFGREPKGMDIGQTFILQDKLINIMENLSRGILSEFETKGISKMPPVRVYGLDANEQKVVAFYIPPIIEIHGSRAVLIDGIHRSYLCMSAGTTINAVHLSNVSVALPFESLEWADVRLVQEKPPIEQRYKSLTRKYFRDLGIVGIDG